MVVIALFLALVTVSAQNCPDASHSTFTVSQNGDVFTILGAANPKLTLKRECQYQLELDASVTSILVKATVNGATLLTLGPGPATEPLTVPNIVPFGPLVYVSNSANPTAFGAIDIMDPAETGTCKQLCSDVRVACQDAQNQYASQEECEAVCALYTSDPSFTPDPTNPHPSSRQCRAQQALDAAQADTATEPDYGDWCANAGVYGGGVPGGSTGLCGLACTGICEVAIQACTSNPLFASVATCQALCGSGFAWQNSGGTADNSMTCRLPYLRAAALTQAGNCAAVSLLGGGTCGDQCANYCANRAQAGGCNEMNTGACVAACGDFTLGSSFVGFGTGDNLQCYNANAIKASVDADTDFCILNDVCPGPPSSSSAFSSSSVLRSSSSSLASSSSMTAGSSSSANDGGNITSSANQFGTSGVPVLVALVVAALF